MMHRMHDPAPRLRDGRDSDWKQGRIQAPPKRKSRKIRANDPLPASNAVNERAAANVNLRFGKSAVCQHFVVAKDGSSKPTTKESRRLLCLEIYRFDRSCQAT
jgi:hypothetical protein